MNRLPLIFVGTSMLMLVYTTALAQKLPFKVGKVLDEEMVLSQCDFYPEAPAMILGEYGSLRFIYDNDDGWKYRMDVAVRKKIFKITEADEANVRIRMYEPEKGTSREEISSLKAYSYNLKDGKVEREKVDNKEYFTKRLNEYWVEVSFAIPNVQEGSVIEYEYTKTSDYITNLSTWYFQSDLPTAHSEFRYTIPEYFRYQASQLGNIYEHSREDQNRRETFTYKWQSGPGAGGRVEKGTGTLNSNSKYVSLTYKNVPPIEDEPYTNNKTDAPSRIQFQLISTQFPNRPLNIVAGSYDKFNHELLTSSAFGDRLNRGGFIKDLEPMLAGKEGLEKAQVIYNHVMSTINWNGNYGFLSSDSGRPTYNAKEGDVGDINLTLVAAMRAFSIEAFPIILSTRGHGTVHPLYPSYEDFNYVIAGVVQGGNIYFCDAVSGLPFGHLPLRCRNGKGWLVREPAGQWVDMKSSADYTTTVMLTTGLDGNKIVTHIDKKESGYAAFQSYSELQKSSKSDYAQEISSKFVEGQVENVEISDVDYKQPMSVSFDLVRAYDESDIIYMQPILMGTITENPFKRETRTTTVDFPYAQSYKVIAQITVPDGYSAELPESAHIKLPDNKGTFLFNATQGGNTINVVSQLKIEQKDYGINDYPMLRQFYQLVADKNQEMIVLSR